MKWASKLEVLEFIKQREIISPLDLMNRFGYPRSSADSMLHWLRLQRLVINDRRGEWTLTDDGIRRLIYYGRFD